MINFFKNLFKDPEKKTEWKEIAKLEVILDDETNNLLDKVNDKKRKIAGEVSLKLLKIFQMNKKLYPTDTRFRIFLTDNIDISFEEFDERLSRGAKNNISGLYIFNNCGPKNPVAPVTVEDFIKYPKNIERALYDRFSLSWLEKFSEYLDKYINKFIENLKKSVK
jgi:hypothetical protein